MLRISFRYLFCILLLLLVLAAGIAPVSAAVHTLNPNQDIETAINEAASGDTIILNPGTYSQHDITISKDIIIRANLSAGGSAENTIIDAAESIQMIFNDFAGHSLAIDNLALRNVTGSDIGGAICFSGGGVVTATSCTFTDCSMSDRGGAIFLPDGGVVTAASCTFTDCSAGNGGAIYSSGGGVVTATSCTFTDCLAKVGGAIYSSGGGVVTVTSCTFTGCSARDGGAISSSDGGVVTATSCTFTGCSADHGGAILSYGDTASVHFSRIYNCNIGTAFVRSGGTFNADNNWWGTNAGPAGYTSGGVDADPWLVLGVTADPSSITAGEASVVRANLTHNSDGTDTSGTGLVPDGVPVAFSVISGSGSFPIPAGKISSGVCETVFTTSDAGITTLNAVVDDQPVSVTVNVNPAASFTAIPLGDTAPLDVAFPDHSTGSPDKWEWSFGDGKWFNTTDSALANPVHTYANAGNYTVGLTVTGGGLSDTLSRADYIMVLSAPGAGTATGRSGVSSSGGGSNTDTGIGFTEDLKTGSSKSFNMDGGAVDKVIITAGTGIDKIMITVRETGSLPPSIDPPEGMLVYEYEDVTIYYADDSALSGRTFHFMVSKSRLASKGYDYGDIVMLHYNDETGEWEELSTVFAGEDGTYYYYSADTPSFSWFAIAVSEDSTIIPESTPETATRVSTPASAAVTAAYTETGTQPPAEEQMSWKSVLIPVLFAVLIAIITIGFVMRRRKEEYPEWWDEERK